MSIRSIALTAASLLAMSATPARADIVTFNSTATSGLGITGNGLTYEEAGLLFTSNYSNGLYHLGTSMPENADPSGATLLNQYQGGTIAVTSVSGLAFDLKSIDLSDYNGYSISAGGPIPFSYTSNGITTDTTIIFPTKPGTQLVTFNLNLSNITQFVFTQDVQNGGSGFQMDNIVFTPHSAAAVPEPSTWGMMIVGFGAVGGAMRYRRRSTKVAFA